MRVLLKLSMPAEKGTEAIKSGALQKAVESAMKTLRPEAAYFYPENGLRTSIMVFDMQGSSQMPSVLEPLFANLGASIYLTPVMNAEDLQKGFKEAGL